MDTKNSVIVSADYSQAVALTQRIIAHAQSMQQSLYEICKGLQEMHDTKLYRELGYERFEDYTEQEVGIRRRQAYSYIKIAETFGTQVQSIAHLGTTKLALLAALDEPTRQEVIETAEVENVSVRELKAQIAQLQSDKEQAYKKLNETSSELIRAETSRSELSTQNADLGQQLDAARERITAVERVKGEMAAEIKRLKEERQLRSYQRESLEDRIRELESRPVEHAVQEVADPAQAARIAELEAQLRAAAADVKRELSIETRLEMYWSAFDAVCDELEELLDVLTPAASRAAFYARLRKRIDDLEDYAET